MALMWDRRRVEKNSEICANQIAVNNVTRSDHRCSYDVCRIRESSDFFAIFVAQLGDARLSRYYTVEASRAIRDEIEKIAIAAVVFRWVYPIIAR
jgi:hypothetical protein